MHELSLMQAIVDNALETAKHERASKIKSITIENGVLSHLTRENIEFWWQTLTNGTLAEEASINYLEKPAHIHCMDCDQTSEIKNRTNDISHDGHDDDNTTEVMTITCPYCNSTNTEILEGLETNVVQLELEMEHIITK